LDILCTDAPEKFNDVKNNLTKIQEKLAYEKIHQDESFESETQRLTKLEDSCSEQLNNLHKQNIESYQKFSDIAEKS